MVNTTMNTEEVELRELATKRVRARRDFKTHLLTYLLVNAFLVEVWYVTSRGFFWPGLVMMGWAVGLVLNAWTVYGPETRDEEIVHEMDRLRHERRR